MVSASPNDSSPTRVFLHPGRETLIVSGPERLSWLNGVVTCDVKDVAPGVGAFGLALNRTGKIQSDLWLVASREQVFVSVPTGHGTPMLEELGRMLIMEDAEIARGEAIGWLTVHGPTATETGREIEAELQGAAGGQLALLEPNDFVLAYFVDQYDKLSALISQRACLGTDQQWQALRIEHGLPLFGIDYDAHSNPHDVSLERRAVSWSKGCYLGQEVVCMQDLRGKAKRRMIPVKLAPGVQPMIDAPVTDAQGQTVGAVTSHAHSARLGCSVAMVRVGASDALQGQLFVAGNAAFRVEPSA